MCVLLLYCIYYHSHLYSSSINVLIINTYSFDINRNMYACAYILYDQLFNIRRCNIFL